MCLDVIAVVKSISDIQTIISKVSQKEFTKRELLLVDEKASITATLWGQQAEEFDGSSHPVVALKGVKVGDYNGRTLSCLNSTLICQDPAETPRTVELRVWFDNEGKSMDLPDLSKGADVANRQTPFKTFSQIISEGLGLGDKPDYVSVKAMATVMKKETAVYMVNITRERERISRSNDHSRCVLKNDVERKLSMKIMAPIDVKNVIKLIVISNGLIWFR